MPPFVDYTGKRFGALVVEGKAAQTAHGKFRWSCLCDCGARTIVEGRCLKSGGVSSCGCQRRARISAKARARWGDPLALKENNPVEYNAWANMINRCENPRNKFFSNYGGRGIKVCAEWRESFARFLSDMGKRPSPGHSLDRIKGDGNYTPLNCRWATRVEQNRNRRNCLEPHEPDQIRWLRASGYTNREIACFFDVHYSSVARIAQGRTWTEAA
jgi:hypothetical protein